MLSKRTEQLEVVEGPVANLVTRYGISRFQIGEEWFVVVTSRAAKPLREGEVVRVLVQFSQGKSVFDVLILQRGSSAKAEYTGPRVSLVLTIVAGAVLAFALDENFWWLLLPAAVLGLLQMRFSMQKDRCLRRFDTLGKEALEGRHAAAAAPFDIPLTLPSLAAGKPAGWPAEILEFTHDAIMIWELDGAGIVYWNRAAEHLYGYSRDEAHGRVTHELLKTRLSGTVGDLEVNLARYGVWVGNLRHTRRDGQIVEVEARLSLMSQERRPWLVLEVNRDVTDRNRAEAERAEIARQLDRVRRQNL